MGLLEAVCALGCRLDHAEAAFSSSRPQVLADGELEVCRDEMPRVPPT